MSDPADPTMPRSPCPDEDAWASFVAGAGSDGARAALEEHLDACGACRRLVSELVRGAAPDVPAPRLGRYELLDLIGSGAMGLVYAAHDPDLDRRVAIKVLRDGGPGGERAREHALREARAIARLAHPNVTPIHDVGVHGDQTYFAMELVEGTLASWLAEAPRAWGEVLDVFVAAGRGLAAAHAAGIVHRDFKPANVLVGGGRVFVSDFGLARADDAPAEGRRVGTPAYMAPEQHAGRTADARADQFAFAVALYEALYGVRPFAGETGADLARAIERGAIRRPAADTERPPPGIYRAIVRALAFDPDARYASMDDLLRAIDDARRPSSAFAPRVGAALAAIGLVGGLVAVLATRDTPRAAATAAAPSGATASVTSAPPPPSSPPAREASPATSSSPSRGPSRVGPRAPAAPRAPQIAASSASSAAPPASRGAAAPSARPGYDPLDLRK